jgi:putative ABC transport system permease protein
MMRFLLAASGLVLLIGCANLANMLLARTRLREKEIGVQAALGATRANLLRPLVIEAVMIGVIGAVGAVLMTTLAFDVLLRQVPPQAFGSAPVGVGPRVVLFALALGIAGGLIFAAAPAYRASRMDAQALLRGVGSRGATRGSLGSSMLVAQVALAIVLVFGAMIAARAFIDVLQVPLGFDPDGVVMARVAPDGRGGVGFQDFYRRAMEAIGDRTDVVSVGAVGSIPFGGGAPDEGVVDAETGAARAGIYHVLPGYFETAQIPLLRGHLPTWADIDGAADIAVIPESTARALFGSSEPIGATFSSNRGRRLTVVGIVGEVTHTLAGESRPQAYVIPGAATRGMWVVARVRNHNDQTLAALRRQLGAMRPGMPVTATWWSDSIGSVAAMRSPRFQTLVLGSFAALGLGLTALGVFGLVAFLVAHRMREMGIRLAIGATPNALVALSMRQSLLPAAVGVAIGLLATVWLSRVAESQLYEVNANDPATLTLAVISVVIAALVAAWFPARHAGRVDPMTVLRME